MTSLKRLNATRAPASVILIRIMVGAVFLTEGVLKFMYPGELGVGRFTRIGIPHPGTLAPFVGTVETVCGALLILGLLTRPAALLLVITICVAIISTKIPMLLGHGYWTFKVAKLPRYGFLSMMHEARADFSMLLGGLFLLIVGAGPWSLDARFAKGAGNTPKGNTNK